MYKLDKAKEIIKKNFNDAQCGLFNVRNIVGDDMITIYDNEGLIIDICYQWSYFEVFGLSEEEFEELMIYYNKLGGDKE